MKSSKSIRIRSLLAGVLTLATVITHPALAATTNYWSPDGTTLGALGATVANSTWDTTSVTNWGAIAGPFNVAWVNANNDTAAFTNGLATATT